jgi:anti-sigma regulatory factor (Ser/Thr protein kinase)
MESTRALKLANVAQPARSRIRDAVEFKMSSRASSISRIRSRVRAFARSMGFTEASTNAVKHGRNPAHPYVGVRMENRAGTLTLVITDSGPGFDPSTVCPPREGDLCECGRGIMCMRLLMDEVVFHALHPGTRVELVKYKRTDD